MTWLVVLHAAVAATLIVGRGRIRRAAFPLAAAGPLTTLALSVYSAPDALAGRASSERLTWVSDLDLELLFRIDAYALLFLGVIGVAGTAITLHAGAYFTPSTSATTFAGIITLFSGSMAALVASDHLLTLFVFWELTTLTSYFLIGHTDSIARARSAALHAALVTGGGGLALLAGLVLIGEGAGTYVISEIVASPPAMDTPVALGFALVLAGAVTKSAQVPFHGWLPGAMAAPTPASALLHSATMVKAGIFVVGRLGVIAVTLGWWAPVVAAIGFATMLVGGWVALRQDDLKLLLAYGTVSQLGAMFAVVGSGSRDLVFAGLALLVAHAAFKAALFMVVGTIDKITGTRDLRRLGGLGRAEPALATTALAAVLSMAGVPLTFGFAAKEAVIDGLVGTSTAAAAAMALGSVLTVMYSIRFAVGVIGARADEQAEIKGRSRGLAIAWPAALLAGAGVAFGAVPAVATPLIEAAGDGRGELAVKLAAWPGWIPALAISLASLAAGAVLGFNADVMGRLAALRSGLPDAAAAFAAAYRSTLASADRVSRIFQHGSLPVYVGTILVVAAILPGFGAVSSFEVMSDHGSGSAVAVVTVLAAVVVAAAVAVMFVRRRFGSVILLGAVGYGIAGIFLRLGGPDLALTQLLVETLIVALFALALRRLPTDFEPAAKGVGRLLVSLLVGVFVFVMGAAMLSSTPDPTLTDELVSRSEPEAAGRNVVNVILVDFRALDTLGEITVLVVAVLGAAGLVAPVLRRARS